MDYENEAKELIIYLMKNEQSRPFFKNHVTTISKGEVAVLIYLFDEKNGATAHDISERFMVNTSRVAAILKNLTKKGFVERKTDSSDKRKINVYLTNLGKEHVNQKREIAITHLSKVLTFLGEHDTKEYIRIMKRVAYFMTQQNDK
ncbi:MAG: MarR family winged helix-turn-helix transcriptional regulator [Beduini sp.]